MLYKNSWLSKAKNYISSYVSELVLWSAIAITATLIWLSLRELKILETRDFELFTQKIEQKVIQRIKSYELIVSATRGLFMSSEEVTYEEFDKFVSELRFRQNYPGLLAISYTPRVASQELPAFISKVQKNHHFKDFSLWPDNNQADHFPILYIKPDSKGNLGARGFDVGNEALRREALEQSRDNDNISMSRLVSLVQGSASYKSTNGFFMAMPLFKKNFAIQSVQQRREALSGYITCVFNVQDFFAAIINENKLPGRQVNFRVFEGDGALKNNLVFDINSLYEDPPESFHIAHSKTGLLDIEGRHWSYVLETGDDFIFAPGGQNVPYFIAVIGGLMSFLLFWIVLATKRNEALEKSNSEQLEKALKARDNLMSICSHELRTPLTSLKLQSQILHRRLQTKDASDAALEKLLNISQDWMKQLDRLNKLIEEMLDFARVTSGKITMNIERCNLSTLVTEVCNRIGEQAAVMNASISLEVAPDVIGNWDSFRIEQALINLVENGIKYGNGNPILVDLSKTDTDAFFRVTDFGHGIPVELHEKIFEPYERAAAPSNISGLGLGLFITRRIIEAHNGTISVHSEANKGSTFTVKLPLNLNANATECKMQIELS